MEKINNKEVKENSKLMFRPEFIPFYPQIKRQYHLTFSEALVYSFIKFYSSSMFSEFCLTNKQIGEILGRSVDTISKSISKLSKLGLIEVTRTIKAGGGQKRYIRINL